MGIKASSFREILGWTLRKELWFSRDSELVPMDDLKE
jgi:hypothetical protein